MDRVSLAGLVFAFALIAVFWQFFLLAEARAETREWRPWCGPPGGEPELGWHFYCDPEDESPDESPASPAPEITQNAETRLEALREALQRSRAEAVLDPAPEKVARYLRLQRDALARAAAFSDAFRRVVWTTPELDYTLTRPVGALAKQLWTDARREERDAFLKNLGERFGLIYVGHRACMGCQVFGPLLRAFALRHGIDVLAVSLDGGPLEGWPEAVPDDGRAARMGFDGVTLPAVALFDAETGAVRPVGFGVLAEDQLAERIFVLIGQEETGHDF